MTAEEKLKELYKQRTTVQLTPKIIDLIASLVVERIAKERRDKWEKFIAERNRSR